MIKVLIINNEMRMGGTEKVLLTLSKYIDKSKFDITILLAGPGDEWEDKLPKNIRIKYIFKKHPRNFNKIARKMYYPILNLIPGKVIQNTLIKEEYDVYIAFKEVMLDYLKCAPGKKICWIHRDYKDYKSDILQKKNIFKRMYNFFVYKSINSKFNKCDKIVCVSETSKKSFLKNFTVSEDKVCVNYNPNDIEKIRKLSQEEIDFKFNEETEAVICAVGRLEPVKAFHRLINIADKLKKEQIKFKLIIIGDGEESNKLKSMIENFGLKDFVHLVGFSENPYKYMINSSFLVCSSLSEAFSTVATEAIILGIPVVTTLCSGMEELLGPNRCGVITENNEEDLYKGIRSVILNPELLKEIKNGAECRKNDFNIEVLMKKIESTINVDSILE